MGRWTLRHTDEVLVAKIEAIINGAIRRSKEGADEKSKPLMTYEAFVESLDEDDSFTTTLIEILLKELTDRRTRPTPEDRRLISMRTVENLHNLSMTGTYQGQLYSRSRNRSTTHVHTSGILSDEDEDDFGMSDGMGVMEGARIDSALYDVYSGGGGQLGNPRAYPPGPAFSPPSTRENDMSALYRPYPFDTASIPGRQLPVPHNHFGPPGSRPRWSSVFGSGGGSTNEGSQSGNGGNATSLVRRNSIYRPNRRAIIRPPTSSASSLPSSEFAEFTTRRRLSHRLGTMAPRPPPLPTSTSYENLPRAALFDPPSPTGRDNGTRTSSPSSSVDGEASGVAADSRRPSLRSARNTLLRESRENDNTVGQASGDIIADWRTLPPVPGAPRIPHLLRRGGIQPPETILPLPPADSILPPEPSSSVPEMLARALIGDSHSPPPVSTGSTGTAATSTLLRPEGSGNSSATGGGTLTDFEQSMEFDPWFRHELLDRPPAAAATMPPREREVQETPASLPTPRSVSPTDDNVPSVTNNSSGTA
ncbi:uncharacterized protein FOMMEDRAFT_21919 [Fomitiporia mediterranea MF3/22]|uniref:uncharacterized protein n=1 Tax=Fomitiporia mediterranea (strain MF3/22) TaxID=694068 RepID=UPI0004407F7B|nr:uncharacterized protein FOMMEDRAFT_21919 [Fomitiporia mediterranea MF3/22]EJD01546.1 hypothetical protein FOMMEDRAFT_21919 [Fomitiporia mediterranea MF3/22]